MRWRSSTSSMAAATSTRCFELGSEWRKFAWSPRNGSIPTASLETEHHLPVLDPDRVGPEVDADRGAPGLAGADVEAAIVLGALDDAVHHQAVREMRLLVGAEAVGRIVGVSLQPVDGEGAAGMVE